MYRPMTTSVCALGYIQFTMISGTAAGQQQKQHAVPLWDASHLHPGTESRVETLLVQKAEYMSTCPRHGTSCITHPQSNAQVKEV